MLELKQAMSVKELIQTITTVQKKFIKKTKSKKQHKIQVWNDEIA